MIRSLDKLFLPFETGKLSLRNRFIMPAMQIGTARHSVPTEDMAQYLRERAAGGAALVFTGSCSIDHPSAFWKPKWTQMTAASEDGWRRVVDVVKKEGARIGLQLWHPGAVRVVEDDLPYAAHPSLSPSGLASATHRNGRAMNDHDLDDIKGAYAASAERAKKIGFDAVELHGAHGFLIDQFLWSETNLREDGYGGAAIADRARYPAQVVAAIRAAVGEAFFVSVKLSQFKEADYGARIVASPDELGQLLAALRAAGADCFDISTRRFNRAEWPERHPTRGLAGWAKQFTDATVITVGGIGLDTDILSNLFDNAEPTLQIERDFEDVVARLELGEFDLIALGRSQVANSDFVRKLRDGAHADLAPFRKAVHLRVNSETGEAPNYNEDEHVKHRKSDSV